MNKSEIELIDEISVAVELFELSHDSKLLAQIYVNILELTRINNISEIDFDTLVMNELIKG